VDLFANRWVFGIRHPFPASANRLLPEYQHVAVDDLICDGPNYASYFRVLRVDISRRERASLDLDRRMASRIQITERDLRLSRRAT
jgi:hypothetical protein